MSKPKFIYFDSSVFLAYFNGDELHLSNIEAVLAEIKRDEMKLITSSFTVIEVAYIQHERLKGKFAEKDEERLDEFWANAEVVLLVDLNPFITKIARDLVRTAKQNGHSLKPGDAVHLATAKWVSEVFREKGEPQIIREIHAIDEQIEKFSTLVGLTICPPQPLQPRLL